MSDSTGQFGGPRSVRAWAAPALVAAAALAMGLPTIGGGFAAGDDQTLVLNHVYVNHPSLEHAVELFTIPHRDLYQPIPLLMFSGEFALAYALDLFRSGDPHAGGWLFHLSNIVLHAVCALLVWRVIRELDGSEVVALLVALVFAVHPLQVEVVAWLNGRMMMLSTLFALAAMIAFRRFLDRKDAAGVVLMLLLCALSGMSKARVAVPVLLLIVALARRVRFSPGVWAAGIGGGLVTAAFVGINVYTTSEAHMFAAGTEHFEGPNLARVVRALGFYLQHLVWPTGLASWYPPPKVISWTDAETLQAFGVLAVACVVLGFACAKSRSARFGVLWFVAGIFDTLPFVPARNILAADRYMYLPIIGLAWAVLSPLCSWVAARAAAARARPIRGAALAAGTAGALALLGVSWVLGQSYRTSLARAERIAYLFPGVGGVWAKLGWSHYFLGDYEKAMEAARSDLDCELPPMRADAHQVIGMSLHKLGRSEEGLEWLRKSIEIDSEGSYLWYRLGVAYDELGRTSDAVATFEHVVAEDALNNPALNRLARLYADSGRAEDARRAYEQAVANNAFEVPAIIGLAELDIQADTRTSLDAAVRRLMSLLDWMPENVPARINLGVAYHFQGRDDRALVEYRTALRYDPLALTAAVNAAALYEAAGHVQHAMALWEEYTARDPANDEANTMHAWALALNGKFADVEPVLRPVRDDAPFRAFRLAARALASLGLEQQEAAVAACRELCGLEESASEPRQRLLKALERFDLERPGVPWTYLLTAMLLDAEGQPEARDAFVKAFTDTCADEAAREWGLSQVGK